MTTVPTTEAEFAALAERHRRELHVHCYRMLGSFEEAEDLVQETLLRAWRGRAALERDELAARVAVQDRHERLPRRDQAQRAARRRRSSPSATSRGCSPIPDRLLDEVAPADEEPDAAVVARETIELTFLAVIQLLPPRQRAVLILRDVLDWPARETAELLEIGVAAVNSALQRARATLRTQLPPDRREDWAAPEVSERRARAARRASSTPTSAATPRPRSR